MEGDMYQWKKLQVTSCKSQVARKKLNERTEA